MNATHVHSFSTTIRPPAATGAAVLVVCIALVELGGTVVVLDGATTVVTMLPECVVVMVEEPLAILLVVRGVTIGVTTVESVEALPVAVVVPISPEDIALSIADVNAAAAAVEETDSAEAITLLADIDAPAMPVDAADIAEAIRLLAETDTAEIVAAGPVAGIGIMG